MNVEYQGPVNLENQEEHTVAELAQIIKALTASKSEVLSLTFPEMTRNCGVRRSSLQTEFLGGWRPKVPPPDGLLETIEYFTSVQFLSIQVEDKAAYLQES
jgi:UDP-glucuronate decarboxylase